MVRVTRELEFGEIKVTVKELTVAEVRAWLNEPVAEDNEFDLLTSLLSFDGIGMNELYRFTDLQKESVEQLPPSALKKIATVVRELNSVFFNEYLVKLGEVRQHLERIKAQANSNAA